MYQLEAIVINRLIQYLAQKPYAEVYELIEHLKNAQPSTKET